MDESQVATVRRFNRTVTARVGALDDRYLSRDRPLGQSRVLWEIGPRGCEVATLRSRLALDSAQLSRTLRTLESDGLVTVAPHGTDGRVRLARLTRTGRAEWDELDRRSAAAAAGILTPLTATQRDRITAAMSEVERLLLASMVEVSERAPSDPTARACLRAYTAEITDRFGGRFTSAGGDDRLVAPHGLLLVATLHDDPVGCGALRFTPGEPPEIKRLWCAGQVRGMGLGRRLLTDLEDRAAAAGARRVRLDTAACLSEAIALYRASGYREIARYNDNPDAAHWFEKDLPDRRS